MKFRLWNFQMNKKVFAVDFLTFYSDTSMRSLIGISTDTDFNITSFLWFQWIVKNNPDGSK